jgi:hypothetical protein
MKQILLLIFLALPCVAVSQQFAYGVTISFVPLTSVSQEPPFLFPNFSGEVTSRPSVEAGLIVKFTMGENLSLNTSIEYRSKLISAQWHRGVKGALPAILTFHSLGFIPRLEYNPFASVLVGCGPVVDFNLGSFLEVDGEKQLNWDPIAGTKNVRLGAVVSVGYLIEVGPELLMIPELSYDIGLTQTNALIGEKYSSMRLSISLLLE